MRFKLSRARTLDTEPPGIYSIQNAKEWMRRISYAFKDLVTDVREVVRSVFYPGKILVKSGNLLVRSQAGYDTFFADAQKSVA
jgi:hypothetical protein